MSDVMWCSDSSQERTIVISTDSPHFTADQRGPSHVPNLRTLMTAYDVIVIGAGPAGEVLAGRTAAAGLSTAIVEERLVGGGCGFTRACRLRRCCIRGGSSMR